MAGSTFGELFRVTTFGESHGPAVGCIVDGCPAGLPLDEAALQIELDRRRPGQSRLSTARREGDQVEILSGVFQGHTIGTPIGLLVRNQDAKSRDYETIKRLYRPGHADYTWDAKNGRRDWRGGGRSSARETVGRVAGGTIARLLLAHLYGTEIVGWVSQVRDIRAHVDPLTVRRDEVERLPVRCPDPEAADAMTEAIHAIKKDGDTIGGTVECIARNVPVGWGEPVFDKVDALLASAMMSLPAAKSVEIGSGLESIQYTGSEHNDPFEVDEDGRVRTRGNRAGGTLGGITNGMPVFVRTGFKPVATHFKQQSTVTAKPHENTTFTNRGRHDPCVLPRAVVIVESMMALVLADLALRQRAAAPLD